MLFNLSQTCYAYYTLQYDQGIATVDPSVMPSITTKSLQNGKIKFIFGKQMKKLPWETLYAKRSTQWVSCFFAAVEVCYVAANKNETSSKTYF